MLQLSSLIMLPRQNGLCTCSIPEHLPQLDMFDYKPGLEKIRGQNLPDSIRQGQRLTAMTATQSNFPVAPSMFQFRQHGNSGTWISELLPHTAGIVDQLCIVKSMHTEAINHDPAVTFFQTGAQLAGRPSIGSWISYGLGSENKDLPGFVVMVSSGTGRNGQPLYDRLWGSGFLPTRYQGVKFRSTGDPVLYLSNPEGINIPARRRYLDDLAQLNEIKYQDFGDPEIIDSYLAIRDGLSHAGIRTRVDRPFSRT